MNKTAKIFVAGHRGMVGNALIRRLELGGFSNLLVRDRSKLDLRDAPEYFCRYETVRLVQFLNEMGHIFGGS